MFDDRLKKVRESRGISVKQAAAALRLPYTTYNNYEKNTREPSGGLLCKLAKFYGVSTDYLLGMEEQSTSAQSDENASIFGKWDKLD
ncbi:MAG: helix-turn-helix domain-containing protein, partial [Ruminococcus sp.]